MYLGINVGISTAKTILINERQRYFATASAAWIRLFTNQYVHVTQGEPQGKSSYRPNSH